MKTFLGTPVLHLGERLGNIYLTEKEGGREFTLEDEETLVMFASQAGMAIVNARRYSDEHRARADLEALVNISPVGVLVFDAKTGDLVSLNQESRRIVRGLRAPGRSQTEILSVLTFRRPDGREIPLAELPTERALKSGETRARRGDHHTAPGRPSGHHCHERHTIFSEVGAVVSVVATVQDMTPLEELERLRAEFPGHGEPRAADAAYHYQRLRCHRTGRPVCRRYRRDAPVLPDHRRAGRSHAGPDRRPSRRDADRGGGRFRSLPNPRIWRPWWTRQERRSCAAVRGTASRSTSRRTCPGSGRIDNAWRRS